MEEDLYEYYAAAHPDEDSPTEHLPTIIINEDPLWFNDHKESIDFLSSNYAPIMIPVFYNKLIRESEKMWFVEVAGVVRKFSKNRSKIDKRNNCIMIPDWVALKINQ